MSLAKRWTGVVLSLVASVGSILCGSEAQAGVLLADSFTYPDGDLSGNGGWSNPVAQSLQVVGGKVKVGVGNREFLGERVFSRAGVLGEIFLAEIDALTPTSNSVFSIIDSAGRQIVGWTYIGASGWKILGDQTSIQGSAKLSLEINPNNGTVVGRLFDSLTNGLLYQSSVLALNASLVDSPTVNLYSDSRAVASTTTFDNLNITTLSAAVPEPASILCFATLVVIPLTRRRT